jgi:hypothetical protein
MFLYYRPVYGINSANWSPRIEYRLTVGTWLDYVDYFFKRWF